MSIFLHNTLSKEKELFKPLKPGQVKMYSCGPTVYDTPHIGNYRSFLLSDLLRRMFEYNDYAVNQVMNITDVDDKTIKRSRERSVSLRDLTYIYGKLFVEELQALNILPPTNIVRATDNIPEMIELIETLIKKGFAYTADDGVYMDIHKVKDYDQLAGLHLDVDKSERDHHFGRNSEDEYDKSDPRDFALWKFKTADDGDVSWIARFGDGRPGWHIECSAMAMKILGPTLDVHTGGADLIFPHHTNEIAQSESATGKKFANYWIHGGFMTVKDEKMAKSKGNFLKLEDLMNASISPLAYRYWLLTAHYRSPIDFSVEAVKAAQTALFRFIETVSSYPEEGKVNDDYKKLFVEFINDDLNMPKALALAWELLKDNAVIDADKRATILDFDRVFGLNVGEVKYIREEKAVKIPMEINALGEAREEARKQKDWAKADALRLEIESRGYEIRDSDDGFVLSEK